MPLGGQSRPGHYPELDGLRGLASAIVVFNHFESLWVWDAKPVWLRWVLGSPLRMIVAGHEAVILFFVLSGFVLTLQTLRPAAPSYVPFLVRRVFRIYVPYLAALVFAILCDAHFHGPVQGMAPWLDLTWSRPPDLHTVLQHVAFLGAYDYWQFNGAFWSLIYEMRLSVVFPALCLLVTVSGARRSLALAVVLSIASSVLVAELGHENWFRTLHYAGIFLVASVLARHVGRACSWFVDLDRSARATFMLSACLLFVYGDQTDRLSLGAVKAVDWGVTVGAIGLVIVTVNHTAVRRVLMSPVAQWLGGISYSIYLVHLPILLVLVHGWPGLSKVTMFALYVGLTLGTAWLFYRLIERPSTQAGRRVSDRMNARGTFRWPQPAIRLGRTG